MQTKKNLNISKSKKILLLFFCLVIFPIAALLVLEAIFSIAAPGNPNSFFIKEVSADEDFIYRANYTFAKRFFPANLARKPLPEIFPANKKEKTFRVFVLGESAARGEFLADFSFSRLLEAVLKNNNPDSKIEIINTGIPAINSWIIGEIADEIIDYQPDLIIIYAGHNEFIGPFGPASIFSGNSGRLAAKLGIFASSLDLIKALKSDKLPRTLKKGWQGLEMFFENRIEPGSKLIQTCNDNWQKNLAEIAMTFKNNKISTLICSVPANLKDCPPFMSIKTDAETKKAIDQLKSAYSNKKWHKIVEVFNKNNEALKNHALANWLKAEAILGLKKPEVAQDLYEKALNLDCFRVRTSQAINSISKKIATEYKTGFLDLVPIFKQNSEAQICSRDLIYDHVHLTFKGHYLAAESIYKFIAGNHDDTSLDFSKAFPDINEIAKLTGFTDNDKIFNTSNIIEAMKGKPFNLQLNNSESLGFFSNKLSKLKEQQNSASDIYQTTQALEKFSQDWHLSSRLANMYLQTGQIHEAIAYFNKTLKQNPFNINSINNAGTLYLKSGNFKEAASLFERALELAPNFADPYFNLALCASKQNNLQKAISLYNKTLAVKPSHTNAAYNLANIYFSSKNYKNALNYYQKVINVDPENLNSIAGAANSMEKLNQPQKAMQLYQSSVKKFPQNPLSHYNLALAFEKRKNIKTAAKHYHKALKLDFAPAASRVVNLIAENSDKIDWNFQLKLSLEACRATNHKDPYCLQALASTYAADNQLNKAATTLHTALELVSAGKNPSLANDIKASLKIINKALAK
ncbi:MAG: tetratricopeptide repeat protein [Candidatus Rifleibacteriota bacterium]